MTISQRIEALREVMRSEHLAACIIPTSDPHQSEYTADHWKGREWISGFNGSAGTAVVTLQSAALWTDSRYFLAAEEQLRGTEYQLMKLKIEGTPTIAQWIGQEIAQLRQPYEGWTEVALDGTLSSANEVKELIADLRKEGGITLRTNLDPLRTIWTDRPPIPANAVERYPLELAGETTHEKIGRIRQALHKQHADGMLMTTLDDIAWTLNLRGSDVHCNPVFVSYLLLTPKTVTLYINKVKLTSEVSDYLKAEGILVEDYERVTDGLKQYFEYNILLDPDKVNYTLYEVVRNKGRQDNCPKTEIVEEKSPVPAMKAIKNEHELAGFRQAMLKDGIAMVRFLKWLEETDEPLTELSIDRKLTALRAQQPLFRGLSFDTISAYAEHGAVVHYEPTPESDIPLQRRGLLLLDSGAQYLDGTTDLTRTIPLGPLTDEECRVYTLVLKGHLRLQNARFPDGASGTQLDAIARAPLWAEGLNYLHGTGHGVGSYLNVHEGPHQIRMEWWPAPLRAGMTVTDEPGIYLEGRFGVRTENILLIVPAGKTECGKFLRFEPLTLCPIDRCPIVPELLTDEERGWLDAYHKMVFERLAPHLNDDEQRWLAEATRPL